jgi:predicted permease
MKQLTIEQTQKFMSRFGVPQEEIDKAVNGMIEKDLYSFGTIMLSFVQGCILWFILALIMAAIMKKKKPVFGE